MSKFYAYRRGFFALWLFVLFISPSFVMSQGISCTGGLRASLDEQCEIVISANTMVLGVSSTYDTSRYVITVNPMVGSSLQGVMTGSGLGFSVGNVGSLIQFSEPGAFTVSVQDLVTGVSCWGDFYVEDKLPPRLDGNCMCPDTATNVTPACTFSCASIDEFYQDSSMTAALHPKYVDNCGEAVNVFFEDNIVDDTTCGGYFIQRTWKTKLTTAAGGSVQTIGCKQKFKFEPINNADILSPESKVVVECGIDIDPESLRNYFSDTTYFSNPNLNNAVKSSYPYTIDNIGGLSHNRAIGLRSTDVQVYCKVFSTYTDTDRIVPDTNCPHAYKVVRTWKTLDWCNNTTKSETQIIAVMDNEAPQFSVNDTIPMSSTNPWTCVSDLSIPAPIDSTISDNCSAVSSLTWSATVQIGSNRYSADASNGYRLQGLNPGEYAVQYEMSDQCGNSSYRSSLLMIKDNAEPVIITKDKIIVTMSTLGDTCAAKVFAHNIDVGSYDACSGSGLTYELKRLEDSIWRSYVRFSQNDITGLTESGYPFGEHMVELRVTDIDGNSGIGWSTVRVEDKNSDLEINCGPSVINLDCDSDFPAVITDSLYVPEVILRSCTVSRMNIEYTILESNINESCNVGNATVAYFIEGSLDTLCIKEFRMGDLDVLNLSFPPKEIEVTCDEDDFGQVVVNGENCNLLAQSVEDQVFNIDPTLGYCKKIIRTYTIIDWCVYQPNESGDDGLYRFSQTIKVKDTNKPIVSCDEVTFSANAICGHTNFTLSASATDEGCSGVSSWAAKVDIDGDNIFDLDLDPIIGENGTVSVIIDTIVRSGTHRILWRATDDCGNATEEICEFTITDDVAPAPQCISGIVTAVMNTTGTVGIWAKDFALDGKDTDQCGSPIIYSFSGEDPNVQNAIFTCDSLENGISTVKTLRVYVWDEFGNRDFCTVEVRIADNANVCADVDQGAALIAGNVSTLRGDNLESAMVMVKENDNSMDHLYTDVTGDYMFSSNPMNYDYSIDVEKTDDVTNGVSTLDLVIIQQYILSLRDFDSPYTVIAADVSGDEKVTALDLVDMRRVILGTTESFSSDLSWKFISAEQVFEDTNSPWPLQESITVADLQSNQRNLDFIAVKLGDVNGNAVANSLLAGTRSKKAKSFSIEEMNLIAGEVKEVTYELDLNDSFFGFELDWELSNVEIQGLRVNGRTLSKEDYHINNKSLKVSYVEAHGAPSFELTIELISSENQLISNAIHPSNISSSEIYIGEELNEFELNVSYFDNSSVQSFELYQNEPNPFAGETSIEFFIAKGSDVELSIFDMTGRQVFYSVEYYNAGVNSVAIRESDLQSKGILYYQVSAGDNVATKKMIVME